MDDLETRLANVQQEIHTTRASVQALEHQLGPDAVNNQMLLSIRNELAALRREKADLQAERVLLLQQQLQQQQEAGDGLNLLDDCHQLLITKASNGPSLHRQQHGMHPYGSLISMQEHTVAYVH